MKLVNVRKAECVKCLRSLFSPRKENDSDDENDGDNDDDGDDGDGQEREG